MKKTDRIMGLVFLGVAIASVVSVACNVRKQRSHHRLSEVANEGYETAHDIIFPNKNGRFKSKRLLYGPVI